MSGMHHFSAVSMDVQELILTVSREIWTTEAHADSGRKSMNNQDNWNLNLNTMEKEQVIKELEELEKKFEQYEMECDREVDFAIKHLFASEEIALRYKMTAYHKCKRDLFFLIDRIKQ